MWHRLRYQCEGIVHYNELHVLVYPKWEWSDTFFFRYSLVIEDIESRVRKESESDLDKIRSQLELEMQKLEDCHREIDIYRQQLETAALEMNKIKSEFIETQQIHAAEKQTLTENSDLEKAEIVKKLTLEHEIELGKLRNSYIT